MLSTKHPVALPICFMTEFWERYGFYISQGLITLVLIHVFGLTDSTSFAKTGTYVGLVYTTSIIGGLIADNYIGHYRSALIGELLLIVGFAFLGYGVTAKSMLLLSLALASISVGTGLVKSNISSFLGHFYKPQDPKRDLGFSIFYIGINLGSLIGGILAGYLSQYLGWSTPFYSAAVGALVGLCTMFWGVRKHNLDFEHDDNYKSSWAISIIITLLTVAFCVYVLLSPQISDAVFIVISFLCVLLLIYTAMKNPNHVKNCIAYFVLIIISVVFWSLFFQIFSSMVILIDKLVDHHIFGFTLPTASFFTIESLGVIALGGIVGKFWLIRALKGKPVHDSSKFAIGMLIITIAFAGFAIMVSIHNPVYLISGYIIVVVYFVVAIAELALSPIGLSVSNKLAPKNCRGLFMGIWMISLGLGGKLSGILAGLTVIPKGQVSQVELYHVYSHALWIFTCFSFAALILSLISIPFLKKLFN